MHEFSISPTIVIKNLGLCAFFRFKSKNETEPFENIPLTWFWFLVYRNNSLELLQKAPNLQNEIELQSFFSPQTKCTANSYAGLFSTKHTFIVLTWFAPQQNAFFWMHSAKKKKFSTRKYKIYRFTIFELLKHVWNLVFLTISTWYRMNHMWFNVKMFRKISFLLIKEQHW